MLGFVIQTMSLKGLGLRERESKGELEEEGCSEGRMEREYDY